MLNISKILRKIGFNQVDKLLHFIAGTYIYMICEKWIFDMWYSILTVLIIAILKELIWDRAMKNGTPEIMDVVYTVIGGLLAMFIINGI